MNKIFGIFFILTSFLLFGCNKPNPNPELLDPIYSDLLNEKKEIEGAIAAEEKMYKEFEDAVKKAVPHTGQIKFANKRFYDSEKRLTKLKQMLEYYTLKIETRKKSDKVEYMKAFRKKEPWPDPAEYKDYMAQKALDKSPRFWVVRKRVDEYKKDVPRGTSAKPEAAGGGGH